MVIDYSRTARARARRIALTDSQTSKNLPLVTKNNPSWSGHCSATYSLFPVTEHPHRERTSVCARRCDLHSVVKIVHLVVFEEPIACPAQPGFAARLIDLHVKLRLFVRSFCFQGWCLLFFYVFSTRTGRYFFLCDALAGKERPGLCGK